EDSLDKLERFASFNGADFYQLPRNSGSVTLEKVSQEIPTDMPLGSDRLIPLRAGERVQWTLTRQP
ncbi:MAG: dihydroorotase, partial [Halieaceae bacterium]|nr:dihydroorotase [Halieaceae bacterium]